MVKNPPDQEGKGEGNQEGESRREGAVDETAVTRVNQIHHWSVNHVYDERKVAEHPVIHAPLLSGALDRKRQRQKGQEDGGNPSIMKIKMGWMLPSLQDSRGCRCQSAENRDR